MWIETFGNVTPSPMVAGATVAPFTISRRGLWPNAIAAISSIRAIAISTSAPKGSIPR